MVKLLLLGTGEAKAEKIRIYGSGEIFDTKEHFVRELKNLLTLGICLYKIRAGKNDIFRTAWILEEAGCQGIKVGIDMC